MNPALDAAELGARLRHRRLAARLTVREAARQAEVSAATFSRVERGDHLPERENLLKLADWAGIRLRELQLGPDARPRSRRNLTQPLPETVALHLRADRALKPEDAEMLANLFRTAYETLRRRSD